MKVILTGCTGVVGTECIRIALNHPQITEVVALARRPVEVPDAVSSPKDKEKLKTVVLEDFGSEYPEDVKEQIKGADACIWNLAITPSKSKTYPPEEVQKVCHEYTVVGLKSMIAVANPDHPFRFIYTSGAKAERDQSRTDLWLIPEYRRMRGAVANALFSEAENSNGRIEIQVTKPGAIVNERFGLAARLSLPMLALIGVPNLHVSEIAAAELQQAMDGFDGKDTLENADLIRIGQKVLQEWGMERSS